LIEKNSIFVKLEVTRRFHCLSHFTPSNC